MHLFSIQNRYLSFESLVKSEAPIQNKTSLVLLITQSYHQNDNYHSVMLVFLTFTRKVFYATGTSKGFKQVVNLKTSL